MNSLEEQEQQLLEQLELIRAKKQQQTQLINMENNLSYINQLIESKKDTIKQLQDEISKLETDRNGIKENIKVGIKDCDVSVVTRNFVFIKEFDWGS